MSHLTLETLARVVDEPPTAEEAEHLEGCPECRRELEELIWQTAALRDLPDLLPPPADAWPALAKRLRRERLIGAGRRARWRGLPYARIAASVAIFLAGGAIGFTARGDVEAPALAAEATGESPLPSIRPADDNIEDATRALAEAEAAYRAALARYTELAGGEAGTDPIARLAALDNIVLTTRQALREAPADPVINGYHLAALAQREATMKQLVLTSGRTWY
ncbi:MAG TPA: hypothetical protein VF158_10075 [Longimicrobiales bacterium]